MIVPLAFRLYGVKRSFLFSHFHQGQVLSLKPTVESRSNQTASAGRVTAANRDARERQWVAVALLLAVGMIFAICLPWLTKMIRVWRIDPNYSHGPLVPLISLALACYALHHRGGEVRLQATQSECVAGAVRLLLGIVVSGVGWFTGILLVGVVGLVWMIGGLILLAGGRAMRRLFGFATMFLLFMAPIPAILNQWIAVTLQGWVSVSSAVMLRLTGIPVLREGTILHLPGYTLEVGAACSGLRQLMAFVALSAVAAHLGPSGKLGKAMLLIAAPLVAVAANGARVVLSGWTVMIAGPQWAAGVWHALEGAFTVAIGAVLLSGLAWCIMQLERRRPPARRFSLAADSARPTPCRVSFAPHSADVL